MEERGRYQQIIVLFVVGALILTGELMYYQLFNAEARRQAENRSLSEQSISPPRGVIMDRNDQLIVVNEPSYDLEVIVGEIDPEMDTLEFCNLLHITVSDFEQLLADIRSRPYYRRSLPITFLSKLSPKDYAAFQEHLFMYPGFYTKLRHQRNYPQPYGAHVLGYISEVNPSDLQREPDVYSMGDVKGASGVEKVYEPSLRGKKGVQFILKDNLGREVESFMDGALDSAAVAGRNLKLSLDFNLQALGEELMKDKRGSIVAIEPATGEVLCMVSSPSYDPNSLTLGRTRNNTYFELLTDSINRPLLDRNIQAQYPPGSIFKPILSLISFQEGVGYPNKTISCSGEYVINAKYSQGCRNHPSPVNIYTALQYSCNSYFFQMLRDYIDHFGYTTPQVGMNKLHDYLVKFGLGQPLGVDLLYELGGFVPDGDFYDKVYNTAVSSWRSTAVLSLGIGQGEFQLTTLQMANLAAIIANRGFFYTPHLVKSIAGNDGRLAEFRVKREVGIDAVHFPPVIEGMERVISSGTGFRGAVPGFAVCGKTGTSQNPQGIDHSVFFAFAPKDDPKIALAVFVENAGGGGALAAPIASLMMEQYLTGSIAESHLAKKQSLIETNLIHQSQQEL